MASKTSASSCVLAWDAKPPIMQLSAFESISGQYASDGGLAPNFLRMSPCTEYRLQY
jgi:hypothetical protein